MSAPAPRAVAYVGLGANLGDARSTLASAAAEIARCRGVTGLRMSSIYRSAPLDAGGPDFFNAVVEVATELEPIALLDALQAIEAAHGRERPFHHAPRTLDLDLLVLGDRVIETPRLSLPHPRLHQRAFVLLPLLELNPGLVHPLRGPLSNDLGGVVDQRIERLA